MMSYCKDEGKDKVVFITKEDYDAPVKEDLKYLLEEDEEEAEGLILPNGDINWSCPCLGGMASGPCSMEFRDAFSCFHYSTEEPKGSDCIDYFRKMQECMMSYPELYPTNDEDKNTESESEPVPSNISTESANTEPIDTSGKDKSGS